MEATADEVYYGATFDRMAAATLSWSSLWSSLLLVHQGCVQDLHTGVADMLSMKFRRGVKSLFIHSSCNRLCPPDWGRAKDKEERSLIDLFPELRNLHILSPHTGLNEDYLARKDPWNVVTVTGNNNLVTGDYKIQRLIVTGRFQWDDHMTELTKHADKVVVSPEVYDVPTDIDHLVVQPADEDPEMVLDGIPVPPLPKLISNQLRDLLPRQMRR